MKPIKTASDHAAAIARIQELIELQPSEDTKEYDELEILTILTEAYERERIPRDLPNPIDAIKLRVDQLGLTPQDLEPIFGSRSKVSEVLNGRRPLSLTMIRRAHKQLGIASEVLLQETADKSKGQQDIDVQSLPIVDMWKQGYFPSAKGKTIAWVKRNASSLVHELYSVFGDGKPQQAYCRRSKSQSIDEAFTAWQARCTQLANEVQVPNFSQSALTEKFPREIAKLSFYEDGPLLAINLLNRKGIKVITLKRLPRTRLDGAAFLSSTGHPIIGLTLRFDRADNFWFTLLHEIGHVYRDLHDTSEVFFDNKEDTLSPDTQEPREQRANEFAADSLIPSSLWDKRKDTLLRSPTAKKVYAFAEELEIDPAIVAGRISWERNEYRKLAKVTNGSKIKHYFSEV